MAIRSVTIHERPKEFGRQVQWLRRHGRMTVEELAESLGVDPAWVQGLESGFFGASPVMRSKLALAFQISVDELER